MSLEDILKNVLIKNVILRDNLPILPEYDLTSGVWRHNSVT